MEQNLKRKKEKEENKKKKAKAARRQSENKEIKSDDSTGLSDKDKEMLARWENMRKQTKPFIHPIRKYMQDLKELKDEVTGGDLQPGTTVASQPVVPPGSHAQQQFQFTQFVPQNQNGCVTGLKAVRVPNQGSNVMQTLPGSRMAAPGGKSNLVHLFFYQLFVIGWRSGSCGLCSCFGIAQSGWKPWLSHCVVFLGRILVSLYFLVEMGIRKLS